MKNKKGFVVSAVLYPLLVLFLAIIMGLLSMTDTRKRILDKMKLEITDNIFDDAACSCDTILAKLNYIIANGTGGSGGDTGSYAYNKLTLNVKTYEAYSDFPVVGNIIGDIAVLSTTPIKNYYVSTSVPKSPQEGTVWIVQDNTSNYYVTSDWNRIGISYVMQYENSKWVLKKSYVYNGESWTMLYYVNLKNGYVDLTGTDINAQIEYNYDYTGEYQTFKAVFSGYYKIELWGAQGNTNHSSYPGGKGAYTSGEIYLNAGEILYIYVGGKGNGNVGGWNGGGNSNTSYTTSGGGASDVRLAPTTEKNLWNEFDSLKTRIMVASGGGGGYYNSDANYGVGGAGGGLIGYIGNGTNGPGSGANQSLAGYDSGNSSFGIGGFGYGGIGTRWSSNASGGGGYYGGGGSYASSGGGGSSYISGHTGCSSIEEESTVSNIIHNGSAYHYSGYYFLNTYIIDGAGYSWNIVKESSRTNQPTHDSNENQVGNSGNGYARITLQTIQVISKEELTKIEDNDNTSWNYSYSGTTDASGRYQVFTAPTSGIYSVSLWGAQGNTNHSSYPGGKGAYTSGEIYLSKNQRLYVYVGSNSKSIKGGWNGGADSNSSYATSGGGATDVRLSQTASLTTWNEFDSLKTRIMVAAGGGGGYYNSDANYGVGGAGGGLIGYTGNGTNGPGTGASQSLAGYDNGDSSFGIGGFGYGGIGTRWSSNASGGGGYYGGGGSYASSGGGGSSYISGHAGCNSISSDSSSTNIIHTGSAYHYSNYYFNNTLMIDGTGYSWSTKKETSVVGQPTYDGGNTQTGNIGNGYAKIVLKIAGNHETENINELQNKWYYQFAGTSKTAGAYQVFEANKSGRYKIELWGAQGNTNKSSYPGGKGAYTSGEITLNSSQKLYVYVGGEAINTYGGWNGGADSNSSYTTGGGGATDIRVSVTSSINTWNENESLNSRIMVAGGGGGGYYNSDANYGTGGAGGGLTGYNGSGTNGPGTGGTQVSGGYDKSASSFGIGGFGYGGIGTRWTYNASGGSGWYGGGGSYASSGGGGSSYISGHAGCIGVNSSGKSLTSTYSKVADSISYTGYKFTNTQMIDGQGYPWTIVKSSASSGMPSPTSASLITGNTGSGYAKITYLGS